MPYDQKWIGKPWEAIAWVTDFNVTEQQGVCVRETSGKGSRLILTIWGSVIISLFYAHYNIKAVPSDLRFFTSAEPNLCLQTYQPR